LLLVASALLVSCAAVMAYLPPVGTDSLALVPHMPRRSRGKSAVDAASIRTWIKSLTAPRVESRGITGNGMGSTSAIFPVAVAVALHAVAGACAGRVLPVSPPFRFLGGAAGVRAAAGGAAGAIFALYCVFQRGRDMTPPPSIPNLRADLRAGRCRSFAWWVSLWRGTIGSSLRDMAGRLPILLVVFVVDVAMGTATEARSSHHDNETASVARLGAAILSAVLGAAAFLLPFLAVAYQTVVAHWCFRIEVAQPVDLCRVAFSVYDENAEGMDPGDLAGALLPQYLVGLPELQEAIISMPEDERSEVAAHHDLVNISLTYPMLLHCSSFADGAARRALLSPGPPPPDRTVPSHVRALAMHAAAVGAALRAHALGDAAILDVARPPAAVAPDGSLDAARASLCRGASLVARDLRLRGRRGACAPLIPVVLRAAHALRLGASCMAHGGDAVGLLDDASANTEWTKAAPALLTIFRDAEEAAMEVLVAAGGCGVDIEGRMRHRDGLGVGAGYQVEEWIDCIWKGRKQ